MDLNGDGHHDVISGSYWPGHLFVFEGNGDGEYAAGEKILGADGEPLHAGKEWESERKPDMDSLASAPCAVDYDADGDLDLLVGNIAGRVILIPNEGTAKEPRFSGKRIPLQAGGSVISVNHGDAGPALGDWDGDGRWDLVIGAGDGSVTWFRNTGTDGEPVFDKGVELIPASKVKAADLKSGAEPEGPGTRTKVHVTDYNGDGLADLLVGDFLYHGKGTDAEGNDKHRYSGWVWLYLRKGAAGAQR